MKIANFSIAITAVFVLGSCNFNINTGEDGNGNVVTQERSITEDFTEIKGSSGLDIYLTQGSENKVTVKADENLHQYIETNIENGQLHITTSENIGDSEAKNVYVTFKNLTRIVASSGAEISGTSVVKSKDLSLKCTSGAEMELEVFSQSLSASTSSGDNMKLSGKASTFNADASSGSELEAKELLTINCTAEASSGAEVTVNVKEKLETQVGSGGEINYYGNPLSINSNESYSGSVNKM